MQQGRSFTNIYRVSNSISREINAVFKNNSTKHDAK